MAFLFGIVAHLGSLMNVDNLNLYPTQSARARAVITEASESNVRVNLFFSNHWVSNLSDLGNF